MGVTAHRKVAAAIGNWLGPLRALLRGMGMGGPASPLLWNAGFDPILVALADALGLDCPTYVDDLMALVWGPQQALEAEILLLPNFRLRYASSPPSPALSPQIWEGREGA